MKKRKMKLAFLDTIGLEYNGDTLKYKGLGGSESALIYMAQELYKKGLCVTVFNKCDKEGVFDGVVYKNLSRISENIEEFDILINSRTVLGYIPISFKDEIMNKYGYDISFFKPLIDRCKYKVVWMHDTFVLGEEWLEYLLINGQLDEVFTLSDFHTNYVSAANHGNDRRTYEVMKRKFFQTRNGIKSYYNEIDIKAKDKNLFVFNASLPKGLHPLLRQIWPRVQSEFPEAKLVVIGGFYKLNENSQDGFEKAFWELVQENKNNKNITFTGIIKQSEVADILTKASYFIYPAAYPETFGISATEALNYNVPLITTRFGALEETAPEDTSYLIDLPITKTMANYSMMGSVADEEQVEKFLEQVRRAYTDDYLRQQKMYAANKYKPFLGWDIVALQWKHHFYKKLGYYLPTIEEKEFRYKYGNLYKLYKRTFVNQDEYLEDYSYFKKNHIDIISPLWNAEDYVADHMKSIASQVYNDYTHYIIDDISTDKTREVIEKMLITLPKEYTSKVVFIKNTEKKYALGNQLYVLDNFIKEDSIVVLLDGDDSLVNDSDLFDFINREYEMGASFTYGSCHSVVDNIDLIAQEYPDKVHKDKTYRAHKFNWGMPYTHLRTFRKSLFDKADKSNFFDENGNIWQAGGDNALFYPLIEKCEKNEIRAVGRIMVNYNDKNPLNDYKINKIKQNKAVEYISGNKKSIPITILEQDQDPNNLMGINPDFIRLAREKNATHEQIQEYKNILRNRKKVWIDSDTSFVIGSRIEIIKAYLQEQPRDKKILEVGSWTGATTYAIYRMGFKDVTALDISSEAVRVGKEKFPYLKWINADIEEYNSDLKYDIILMLDITPELEYPMETIKRIKNMLTPGGFIVFSQLINDYVYLDAHESYNYLTQEDFISLSDDLEILNINNEKDSFKREWFIGTIKNTEQKEKHIETVIERQEKKINNDLVRILIALPTAKNIETETFLSIYYLDIPEGVHVDLSCFYGYRIDQVRNLIVDHGLKNNYDYILFVDSDMILPRETLTALYNQQKDIVSGVYVKRALGKENIAEAYIWDPIENKIRNIDRPEDLREELMEVEGIGFGCVLVKADVLRAIGYPQFQYFATLDFNETISEDSYFCMEAKKKGYKIHLLTTLLFEHIANRNLKFPK